MQFLTIAAVFAATVSALPTLVQRQEEYTSLNYSQLAVLHHNIHRANHSAPNVTWDDDLAATAKKIADTCNFEHQMDFDGGNYGQNLAAGVKGENISSVITDLWYNGEEPLYPAYGREPTDSEMTNTFHSWGHFTQVVWKNTSIIGCATTHCSGGVANTGSNVLPYLTVCNYKTPGNYGDQYAEQVGGPLGNETIGWDYGRNLTTADLLSVVDLE
ncbi:Putative CAP domain-containing protein [Septoria linicola]|uniref:CAP domain-containing protein n=1 Tax=Septoria linicola TaxID=215465 RepID=A0A9Q9AVU6_9PEZI|nr:putative CAP domain-containing protein [Septoria linicola]USW55824.1 Putative CAP domain-containing protein [Septoria linicola]